MKINVGTFALLWIQTGFTIMFCAGFFYEPQHLEVTSTDIVWKGLLFQTIVWFAYLVLLFTMVKSAVTPLRKLLWSLYASVSFMVIQIVGFATLYRDLGLSKENLRNGDYIYFSIITWATVGYGDIVPSENARFAAATEALSGYIFMGVFISLLGSYMVSSLNPATVAKKKKKKIRSA